MTISNVQALSFALIPNAERTSTLQYNFDAQSWEVITGPIRSFRNSCYLFLTGAFVSYVWKEDLELTEVGQSRLTWSCIGLGVVSAYGLYKTTRAWQKKCKFITLT